jgi:MFS superfamily sulfate permease-like transporter
VARLLLGGPPMSESSNAASTDAKTDLTEIPVGNVEGLKKYWAKDLLSGFLVFLIALPLCLGISVASGYPPIAGVFTAVIGGIFSTFVSNSELTIKGPAAGLIVIAVGCINSFGGTGIGDGDWSTTDQEAYRMALAVGVAAAAIQIIFGLVRAGKLGEFFPTSAVHGMLAAIGVVIIAKQFPVALGEPNAGTPFDLILAIPHEIMNMNPGIAAIGLTSLAILFLWPLVKQKQLKRIPAPMIVIFVSVPMGLAIGVNGAAHDLTWAGHTFEVGSRFLVQVPGNIFSAMTLPDFSVLAQPAAWQWVAMFAIIGTLESLLSAKAVDLLDPWKRTTNLDRDNTAIGLGNLFAAFAGGLPMISEIVRSRANIDNGARTRFADLFHALFLLVMVVAAAPLLSMIPLAALGAMLVYTGFRLAHPREFAHVYKIGWEQLLVFVGTLVAVLATDLLKGIILGVVLELVVHLFNGAPIGVVFKTKTRIEEEGSTAVVHVLNGVMFSSWLGFKGQLEKIVGRKQIIVDLKEARFVDHTVMEKLHNLEGEMKKRGVTLQIVGLDTHRAVSEHPHATRRLARA